MENIPPSQAQAGDAAKPAPESSFSFTPIKALGALPRLWDRKPSTPIRAGDKTRKLWKRIRFPFSNMNATQSRGTSIGASKNADYQRGVKRQCVDPTQSAELETEAEQRGRSFLETKWEMEASRKRRKLPEFNFDIHDETAQGIFNFATQAEAANNARQDAAINASPQPLGLFATKTPVYNDAMDMGLDGVASPKPTDTESGPVQETAAVVDNAAPAEAVDDLTQEQEVKLVRSALRSSLDGEDAELLNDFLSRAKAKRAAKAAQNDVEVTEQSSSPEVPEIECSTPRSRRALEELTTNSPSPIKLQISPSKFNIARAEAQDEVVKDLQEETAPASPACRRSTRAKAPSTTAPAVRNTIALRRAKGTEFIFLQRTEAQEVALATKRNTRLNKGKSVFPNVALEALAQQPEEPETNDKPARSDQKGLSSRSTKRKQVSWNEERMAEYEEYKDFTDDQEEEEGERCTSDVGATPRRSSKRSEKRAAASDNSRNRTESETETREVDGGPDSGPTAPTASATAPPRSRRVRRLGDSGAMGSGTPVKTGRTSKPSAASASTGPSTPTKGRRKLTPKSPSTSMLPAPTQSGIPTRSNKEKSMLQASAGCTPTARRVRSRA
ncbi:hypothetical protein PENANT_c005G05228 [Penicillium antarcticum]|uniref:Uncharacterized protein n=1 Tax=Penicillium antarcticum TaxID=416450 RepID=A0A1V6QF29_9EURO|nr:uncharacterized protein N7508_007930 [Penicillium antarcticum]KAJ5297681.1 hypothetical protein N7508_007930 [Penicillium antarcticum]OQD87622.1 hypothetical protein PENANT_c005G05228 [Penicillium antarcticum]